MAGAAFNIVAKKITQIVAIFAPPRFAKTAKLSGTHGVFMAGAVILPGGSFGVRNPFSRCDYFYTANSDRATRDVSVSLSQTLMIKGLTVQCRHVKRSVLSGSATI